MFELFFLPGHYFVCMLSELVDEITIGSNIIELK